MKLKEKISFEEVVRQAPKVGEVECFDYGDAALTHYLNNHHNGASQFYKTEAIQYVKRALEYKFPSKDISSIAAEEALQSMLFDFTKDVPFPEPAEPKFKFIDLFAGIGGMRIAFQKLNGQCVFSSEWDEQAKTTYRTNFGEVPYGDITKINEDEIPKHNVLDALNVGTSIFTDQLESGSLQ